MTFRELEKVILQDGWVFKKAVGSHRQIHAPGKTR